MKFKNLLLIVITLFFTFIISAQTSEDLLLSSSGNLFLPLNNFEDSNSEEKFKSKKFEFSIQAGLEFNRVTNIERKLVANKFEAGYSFGAHVKKNRIMGLDLFSRFGAFISQRKGEVSDKETFSRTTSIYDLIFLEPFIDLGFDFSMEKISPYVLGGFNYGFTIKHNTRVKIDRGNNFFEAYGGRPKNGIGFKLATGINFKNIEGYSPSIEYQFGYLRTENEFSFAYHKFIVGISF